MSSFRPFHATKGITVFLNLKQIDKLAPALEFLPDPVRNKKMQFPRRIPLSNPAVLASAIMISFLLWP
jgi:chemotaxis protein histidine kinase CheA